MTGAESDAGNRVREELLATLLECDKKDIPSVTDASVIIVMGRQRANRCMDGLVLQAGNRENTSSGFGDRIRILRKETSIRTAAMPGRTKR